MQFARLLVLIGVGLWSVTGLGQVPAIGPTVFEGARVIVGDARAPIENATFIVNGGRDPLYPASVVDPYVARLKSGGVDLVYRPQPNAGHDTSWWPDIKEPFETFVTGHPRPQAAAAAAVHRTPQE